MKYKLRQLKALVPFTEDETIIGITALSLSVICASVIILIGRIL